MLENSNDTQVQDNQSEALVAAVRQRLLEVADSTIQVKADVLLDLVKSFINSEELDKLVVPLAWAEATLRRQMGDLERAADSLCRMGACFESLGRFASAGRAFRMAADLSHRGGHTVDEVFYRVSLAWLFQEQERYEEALEVVNQVMRQYTEQQCSRMWIECLEIAMKVNRKLGNWPEAIKFAECIANRPGAPTEIQADRIRTVARLHHLAGHLSEAREGMALAVTRYLKAGRPGKAKATRLELKGWSRKKLGSLDRGC